MKSVSRKLIAVAAIVLLGTVGASARPGEENGSDKNQGQKNGFDIDRWKPLTVLASFVDAGNETVTLQGLHFGRTAPAVFCETEKMKVLRFNNEEVVVRFPRAVPDGTYLFTVARG